MSNHVGKPMKMAGSNSPDLMVCEVFMSAIILTSFLIILYISDMLLQPTYTDNDDFLKKISLARLTTFFCFFSKLKSCVIHKLLNSYCKSMHGCEFWLLSNTTCVFHGVWVYPEFWDSLSPLTVIYFRCWASACLWKRYWGQRVNECVRNRSRLVRAIANLGIHYGRYNSFLTIKRFSVQYARYL